MAPALRGPEFLGAWTDEIVSELMLLVEETMPGDDPGALSPQEYTDVVAYLLMTNGVATGSELTPESGQELVIERPE